MDDHILNIEQLALDDPANVWCLSPSPIWWVNQVLILRNELSKASRELVVLGASFRLRPPKAPVAPSNPCRQMLMRHFLASRHASRHPRVTFVLDGRCSRHRLPTQGLLTVQV